jgi:hypothetical protein
MKKQLNEFLSSDLFDSDPEMLESKVEALSPLLISLLLKSKITKDDITSYLKFKGADQDEIDNLFEDSKMYNRITLKDNEYIIYSLLWQSIKDNNYNISVKLLDMLNKMQGKYEQKLKVDSNEPIKISFG